MSDTPQDHKAKTPEERAQEIKESLRKAIAEAQAILDTYDYSESGTMLGIGYLKYLDKPEYYLAGHDPRLLVIALHELVKKILGEFEAFVNNCTDTNTLLRLEEGIVSHTMDIRRYNTVAEEKIAMAGGDPGTFQHNQVLQSEVSRLLGTYLNHPKLVEFLQGEVVDKAAIIEFFQKSVQKMQFDDEGFKLAYSEFVKLTTSINSNITVEDAMPYLFDFLTGLKYTADHATARFVKDLISNIFTTMMNFFMAAEIGRSLSEN